jgi:hypothetical protein
VTGIPKQGFRCCILHFRDYEDYEPAEGENKLAGTEVVDAEEMTVKVDIAFDFGRQGMESGKADMDAVLQERNHRHALVVPTIGQWVDIQMMIHMNLLKATYCIWVSSAGNVRSTVLIHLRHLKFISVTKQMHQSQNIRPYKR